MFKCERCGAVFAEPWRRADDGYGFDTCPDCGSDEFHEVSICKCGGYKHEDEPLCEDCRVALANACKIFLRCMDPAELDQIDEWMDGESIHDYKNWR